MDKIKIGVAGTGHMGRYHVALLAKDPKVEFVGIFDKDETTLKDLSDKHHVDIFTSYDTLLEKVDAIVIAVPTFLHKQFIEKAFMLNKHVFVEKPITVDSTEAKELQKIAKEKNLVLQIGYIERFNGAILALKPYLDDPKMIQAYRVGPPGRILDVGVVLDLMIHDIDICLSLVPSRIESIKAEGLSLFTPFEDAATAILRFENGTIVNLMASRISSNRQRSMDITQIGTHLSIDFQTQSLTRYEDVSVKSTIEKTKLSYFPEVKTENIEVEKGNALQVELDQFLYFIQNKEENLLLDNGIKALEIANSIIKQIKIK